MVFLTLQPPSSWLSLATCFSDEVSVPDFLVATRLRTLNLFTEAEVSMSTTAEVADADADESETDEVSCCNLLAVGRLSLLRMAAIQTFQIKPSVVMKTYDCKLNVNHCLIYYVCLWVPNVFSVSRYLSKTRNKYDFYDEIRGYRYFYDQYNYG